MFTFTSNKGLLVVVVELRFRENKGTGELGPPLRGKLLPGRGKGGRRVRLREVEETFRNCCKLCSATGARRDQWSELSIILVFGLGEVGQKRSPEPVSLRTSRRTLH